MEPLIWILGVVFVVSFLSNVSPFVGASYTLLATLYLTLIGPTPLNFVAVAIVSAIGATVAKMVIYYGAFGFKDLLLKNKNVRLIGRYSSTDAFYLALFVTALLPVFPFDDYIYIGAGAVSASLRLMLGVTLLAKVVKSGVEIAVEYTILRGLSDLLGIHRLDLTLLLTAAFIIIGIVVYKVDWEAAYARLTRKRGPPTTPSPSATSG
jgi:membrane protein DedA with SNARE-associated domain